MKKINFRLILITDRKLLEKFTLYSFILRCCSYGIKAVQLREKDLTDRELLVYASGARKATSNHFAKFIVNDRIDIAILFNADGIQSPEKGIQINVIKKFLPNILIGKSVHSLESAKKAERNSYDYIICGPVFETESKIKYGKPLGLDNLKKICESVKIPVFAIGGINPERAKECMNAGAYGVGVIGSIFKSSNLQETINEFRNALGGL